MAQVEVRFGVGESKLEAGREKRGRVQESADLAPRCIPWHRPPLKSPKQSGVGGQVWCSEGVELTFLDPPTDTAFALVSFSHCSLGNIFI